MNNILHFRKFKCMVLEMYPSDYDIVTTFTRGDRQHNNLIKTTGSNILIIKQLEKND